MGRSKLKLSSKFKRNIVVASFITLGAFSYLALEDYIKENLFKKEIEPKTEYNCSDFKTQKEAQNFFIKQGGPGKDPFKLDKNKDGIACEDLS